MDNVIKFPTLVRDTFVRIMVDGDLPYKVRDKEGKLLGYTLKSNKHGIYLTDVEFKVDGGVPVIEGIYKGDVHMSYMITGFEVVFDEENKVFRRYDNGRPIGKPIKSARMAIIYDGVIQVTIA